MEPRPRPDDDGRPGGDHRDVDEQRPEVVRDGRGPLLPLARQVSARQDRRRGLRDRCCVRVAQLDPVVGGDDLTGQRRGAQPDVVRGRSGASPRAGRPRAPRGPRQVGQSSVRTMSASSASARSPPAPVPRTRPGPGACRSGGGAAVPRRRGRPPRRRSGRVRRGSRAPASRERIRRQRWRGTAVTSRASTARRVLIRVPRLLVCGLMDEPAPPVAEGPAPAGPLGGLAPAAARSSTRTPDRPSRGSCRSRRGSWSSSWRPSSPDSSCGWPATASGRSSSACSSSTCSIRRSAGSSGAVSAGRSRSSSSTSSGSSCSSKVLALTLTPLVNEVIRFVADFPKLAESLDLQLQRARRVLRQAPDPDRHPRVDRLPHSPGSARVARRRWRWRRPVVPPAAHHRGRQPPRRGLRLLHPAGLGRLHPQGQDDPGRDLRSVAAGDLAVRHLGGHQDRRT